MSSKYTNGIFILYISHFKTITTIAKDMQAAISKDVLITRSKE